MSEFRLEDPDMKNSTLEIGFLTCAIEKDKFPEYTHSVISTQLLHYTNVKAVQLSLKYLSNLIWQEPDVNIRLTIVPLMCAIMVELV